MNAVLGAMPLVVLSFALAEGQTQRPAQSPAPRKTGPEFTRQGLLITNFAALPGTDMRSARRATDAVRSRVSRLSDSKEVNVISADDIALKLERAGYDPDTTPSINDIRSLGKYFRADEFLRASVSNGPSGARIRGDLVLMRDERLRQPLPDAVAPRLDSAAQVFARAVANARAQLIPERRCENALREGSAPRAIAAARDGIARYPRSTLARTCLMWALQQTGASHAEVLAVAREILDVDSVSMHALNAAAAALDTLGRPDEAATYWLRLAATDTTDLDLALRVSYALLDGGNARRAEPFIVALSDAHPDDIRFVHQKWRAGFENKNWKNVIAAGEVLLARDSVARSDPAFFFRLGLAYHEVNRPIKAVEMVARGVSAFPEDERLYATYTQYIKAEADTAVPRGLALFPQSATLTAINARELRARGRIEESLIATKQAVALDSTMKQGQLMVAQLESELGRPDSVLAALHRALERREDSAVVAQFALAKGNALYQAANGTKAIADFSAALRMLAFADSVKSSDQSRFLTGAAALGTAQTLATDASKISDKQERCRLMRLGGELIPLARAGLAAGESSYAEAVKQSLAFLDQLEPYVQQELGSCSG